MEQVSLKRKSKILFVNILTSIIIVALLRNLYVKALIANESYNSIWEILSVVAVCIMITKYEEVKNNIKSKQKKFLIIMAGFIALTEVAGIYLTRESSTIAYGKKIVTEVVSVFILAYLIYMVLMIVWDILSRNKKSLVLKHSTPKNTNTKYFWIDFCVLMLMWMPVLLAYYPGIFAYDASNQVCQVLNESYSTHHPMVHTFLLGKLFEVGHLLGDNNLGVLIYCLIQMGILAFSFSFALQFMKEKGLTRRGYILVICFYGLLPINSMLAISTTKDVIFSAFTLVAIVCFMKMQEDSFLEKNIYLLIGGGALVGMQLFRNNAKYACIICCFIVIALFKRKQKFYVWALIISIIITEVVGISIGITMKPESGSSIEMLSVPIQQVARTTMYKEYTMDDTQKKEIFYFIPEENICRYGPNISDPIKNNMQDVRIFDEPLRFIKLYVKLGIKYPREYIDAFASLTQGYWYLGDTSHAQIYGLGNRAGYLLTNYKAMPVGYEVEHISHFTLLENTLEKLFSENEYMKIPLIPILFTPAFYSFILLFYVGACIYKKWYEKIIPVLILVCYWGTLLLGPVCLIRYIYPVVVCTPCLVFILWKSWMMEDIHN